MLEVVLNRRPVHHCTGPSRRDFLRVGGLGAIGLSALPCSEAAASAKARARSVILVFLGGGMSHLDSFDPKPEAPAEVRGASNSIHTAVPGLRISEKLPLMARVMDRVSLVRSAGHTSNHHETAANWVLSGRLGSPFGDHPAIGAVVAHDTGLTGTLPPYVAVPRNPAFTWEIGKSVFLGERYESFAAGDPDQLRSHGAFNLECEPERLRDRYGRNATGQSMLLARRLVEAGVRFVTVNSSGWDHHARIFESLDRRLPEFDRGMSALVEDLDSRGMFAETLLVVMGEFGRTPKINRDGGRDHWGHAGSLLLAGAGINRGFVLGQTDRHGAYPTDRPVAPADVACTILTSLGIDPRKPLSKPDGRPVETLDRGEVVSELFA